MYVYFFRFGRTWKLYVGIIVLLRLQSVFIDYQIKLNWIYCISVSTCLYLMFTRYTLICFVWAISLFFFAYHFLSGMGWALFSFFWGTPSFEVIQAISFGRTIEKKEVKITKIDRWDPMGNSSCLSSVVIPSWQIWAIISFVWYTCLFLFGDRYTNLMPGWSIALSNIQCYDTWIHLHVVGMAYERKF